MAPWFTRWLHPNAGASRRTWRGGRPRFCLQVEELECRVTPTGDGGLAFNLPLTTDADVQQMPSIAVDPLDPQHLVAAYMDRSLVQTGYAGIGVAVSGDGGETWQHAAVPLPAGFDQGAANPITRFDDQGHVFVSFMAATFLGSEPGQTNPSIVNPDLGVRERTLGFEANNSVFVARSDDGGLSWDPPTAIDAHLYDGQNRVPFDINPDLAIDTFPTLPNGQPNPNYGSLYAVWARYYPAGLYPGEPDSLGGSNIMLAVSRDGGRSWQLQLESQPSESDDPVTVIFNAGAFTGRLFPAGLGLENWAHVTVGPEGDLYVSQFLGGNFAVHHSFDGGKSFAHADLETGALLPFGVNNPTGPGPQLSNNLFRTQASRAIVADPTRPGQVYVAEGNVVIDPQGNVRDDGDVIFARSTDYGVTWQTTFTVGGQRANAVNDDNDGRSATGRPDDVATSQALPRLVIDAGGNIGLIWYDTRRDPVDHLLDVFGAVSHDGGLTFSPNFRVTDQSFDADAGAFIDATGKTNYYLGDALGLALGGQTAYAVWTDTRNGNQDVYFARLPLNPLPPPANDRFEPNDTAATATDLGRVIASDLFKLAIAPGDEDWFRVQTAATGRLTVTASLTVPGDVIRLELFDASGTTRLAAGTAVRNGQGQVIGQTIEFPSLSNQAYLVRVLPGPESAATASARYTLALQSLTADLGTRVYGVQGGSLSSGDEAFYALSAAAPGSLEVTLSPGANAQGNWRLELLDPITLDVLARGDTIGAALQASLTVTKGQAVFIHVVGDAGAQGDFTLAFTNLDQFTTADNRVLFFPAEVGPSDVVLADLNGNGQMDLIVSHIGRDIISVLLNNGDGTFQAPRDFAVGAFQQGGPFTLAGVPNYHRALAVGDFNGDDIPDVVVVNPSSSDVSVLLGRGDGTFEPQRRYDATAAPFALAVGDVDNDGILDLVVIDSRENPTAQGAVLLGRGNGTFELPRFFSLPNREPNRTNTILLADLDHDGKLDLVERDFFSGTSVLLGNGDGTFRPETNIQPHNGPGLSEGDLDGDGNLDVLTTTFNTGEILYSLGNGDGTFQELQSAFSGQYPIAMVVADFVTVLPDGSILPGLPDGRADIIAANNGRTLPTFSGPPSIVVLPGLVDDQGNFAGVGDPVRLASPKGPLDVKVGDVNGDGVLDVVAVDRDGILVIFGKPPVISANNTPQTARNLGTVVHLVEPTQTIVPGRTDAYYTLRVPTEAAVGSGDEVLDFSGAFTALEGAGLSMEVRDVSGNLLGSGERFRVRVGQGQLLTLHVFGLPGPAGSPGAGAFTLDINVLPQVVSIESQPLLPGQGAQPGGPTASLVLTFQGDRLDPLTAQDPGNYRIVWLGPDGLFGTADDQQIAIQSGSGNRSVVYDPSTNVQVASGNVYPTAIRQTVTLLFTGSLPAGSYRIELSPAIQSDLFNSDEGSFLTGSPGLSGHPVVSLSGSQVTEGDRLTALNLVFAAGALGDFGIFQTGTPFLTQLHDDLSAVLDAELTRLGDQPTISTTIDNQILDRFDPALGPVGQRPVAILVIWLDPVSPTVVDAQGSRIVYAQQDRSFLNTISRAYVNVTGNLEVIVLPIFAGVTETLRLTVADVPATARGGVLYFGTQGNEVRPLTAELRGGTTEFLLSYGSTLVALISPASTSGTSVNPGESARAATLLGSSAAFGLEPGQNAAPAVPGESASAIATRAAFVLVGTRTDSAPVTQIGPLFRVSPGSSSSGPDSGTTQAGARNTSGPMVGLSGSEDRPPETPSLPPQPPRPDWPRIWRELVQRMRRWLGPFMVQPGARNLRPPLLKPGVDEVPMLPPEEPEPPPGVRGAPPEEEPQEEGPAEAGTSMDCFVSLVGLSICLVDAGDDGPEQQRPRRRDSGQSSAS
jgi:FG-GAP-like repeat